MNWYYSAGSERRGPFSDAEFQQLVAAGQIGPDTLVWSTGMTDWQPWRTLQAAPSGGDAPPPTPVSRTERFEFTGSAGEYFRIWIVNLLLTVVTLGLYAAWAKVRTRRYFTSNTRLAGHAFGYTGSPLRILIGNLIVAGIAVTYFASGAISPFLLLAVIGLLLVLTPWLIVKSLSFNARNTTYRGLRFGFDGKYGEAAAKYVGLPILSAFTLHLLFPWVSTEQKRFSIGRHRLGRTGFQFGGQAGEAYRIFGMTLLFFLPLIVAYGSIIVMAISMAATRQPGGPPPAPPVMMGLAGLMMLPALVSAWFGRYYFQARMFNFTWNNTTLGAHRFRASVKFGELLGLQVVNTLAIVFTLGLAFAWARVRLVRLMLASFAVEVNGSLDDLEAGHSADESAVGDSAADFFDFDIGFGL